MPRRAAAALGLLAAVLTACGDVGGTSEAVRGSASQTVAEPTATTAVATGPAPSTTTTAAGRTTTSRAPTATTTAPAGATTTTTTAAAPAAGPLGPAAPGTYYYDTSGRSTFAGSTIAFPDVTTLAVEPARGARQRLVRNLRDATGNGLASEVTLDYRPEGVFLVSLRVSAVFGGITETRDLRPAAPVLFLPTGARAGAHTEADLVGTTPARLVVDVLGEEQVTVAGRPVDTLVVRTAVTLGPADVTGRQELTFNVDRATGLWVRERSVTDASAAGGLFTLHSAYTATIQSLSP